MQIGNDPKGKHPFLKIQCNLDLVRQKQLSITECDRTVTSGCFQIYHHLWTTIYYKDVVYQAIDNYDIIAAIFKTCYNFNGEELADKLNDQIKLYLTFR